MLKNKTTLISIVLIILAALIYLFNQRGGRVENKLYDQYIKPQEVQLIKIQKENKVIELKSEDNTWYVKDNNNLFLYADTKKILPIFDFINEGRIIQTATQKPEFYKRFEVDMDKGTRLEIQKVGKEPIELILGKDKNYTQQFVRKQEDPSVYLISKNNKLNFDVQAWFYKQIVNIDYKMLDYIVYKTKQKPLKVYFEKTKSEFFTKYIPKGKQNKQLDSLKTAFFNIPVYQFVDKTQKLKSTKELIAHTVKLQSGEKLIYKFLETKQGKKQPPKYYLDLKVVSQGKSSSKLKYLSMLSKKYRFELRNFQNFTYKKDLKDFFEDKKSGEKTKKTS